MYTLEEFSSGKAWSPVKREHPCYFESKGTMKPEDQGRKQSRLRSPSLNVHLLRKSTNRFTARSVRKNKMESEINDRLYHYSYPYQVRASVCGPAAF